ncbi:MAG: hypothetical protein A3H57_00310 [Candidatus Taylorbacteria bacterium RIFCSPLOWO2_02_FULL_43_11]|uniref:AI-2E family transporter n=1 Tax=Candidatus Taylorbacteria bacterium RIFCSPHIGHO2_02_FULL_43_32b TaxID=1802306 RepID=A0A1G2MF02_9BACT|nr:MAG: hypothetical protein A2743_00745 [Candidatus Taylorbacteria bacterium RIFCSPHIGHO2_01_FULL_43_47]OHA22495.1 MAG: hypothetical protein A3C72_00160 [Candidatus Taylorbacteria bacterium RIFCSPHIGHO2_02_FULL_43_32b]OHA29402.1 MAG: hypothetical protein A3B08_03810 [Candidatus Taylorbacteria bacterium RIFCSPLOWO2_01_FULL_43_44]OHA35915.1 MAG: hypothetical protein A3H57_00310 [Candidatus Taylorbacteria bacterium RIFCSPLOWO2_02_FULL_43_11]
MNTTKSRNIFFSSILFATFFLSVVVLWSFITEILLAVVLSVILHPLYLYFLRLLKSRRTLAAIVTIIIAVVCIFTPIFVIGVQIFGEAQNLYVSLQSEGGSDVLNLFASNISEKVDSIIPNLNLDLQSYLESLLTWISANLGLILSSTADMTLSLFLVLVSVFFFLKDGTTFTKSMIDLSPLDDDHDRELLSKVALSINTIIRGTIFVAVVQAAAATVGFIVFGVPNPLLWGSLTGIAAVIPVLGTGLVVIPAAGYLFLIGSMWPALGLLIWGTLIVGMVDNFLKPYLYGKGIQIHPLIMLFAILGGLAAFGPIGFVAGPIVIGLFESILRMYRKQPEVS